MSTFKSDASLAALGLKRPRAAVPCVAKIQGQAIVNAAFSEVRQRFAAQAGKGAGR